MQLSHWKCYHHCQLCVSDDEVLPAKAAGGEEIPDLLNWIEEADDRHVVHVEWGGGSCETVQESCCSLILSYLQISRPGVSNLFEIKCHVFLCYSQCAVSLST